MYLSATGRRCLSRSFPLIFHRVKLFFFSPAFCINICANWKTDGDFVLQNVLLGCGRFVVRGEVLRRPILLTNESSYLTLSGPVNQIYDSELSSYAHCQLLRRFCNDAPEKRSETLESSSHFMFVFFIHWNLILDSLPWSFFCSRIWKLLPERKEKNSREWWNGEKVGVWRSNYGSIMWIVFDWAT